jgi:hypothetical protein
VLLLQQRSGEGDVDPCFRGWRLKVGRHGPQRTLPGGWTSFIDGIFRAAYILAPIRILWETDQGWAATC